MAFDQQAYIADYKRRNTITALLPKGKRKEVNDYAVQHGLTASQLIIAAIESYTGIDLQKGDEG